MSHEYSYQFEYEDLLVQVKVVKRFECLTELEDLRRQWAIYLLQKLALKGTATLDSSDVNCLFARHVTELFDTPVTVTCHREAYRLVILLQVFFYKTI